MDLSEDLLKKPPSPSPSPWLSSPSPSPAKVDLSPKSGLKYYKSVPDCMSQVTKRSTKFGQDTWTFEKKLTGQTHSVAGQGDRSAMYLAGNDLLVSLDLLVSVERRKTSSHLIDEDAERPPVYRIIVTLEWQTDRHTNGVKNASVPSMYIVLQCYDTVGLVMWPVKPSPKWPIMCRVGR